jgi:hypothetical protein
MNLYEEISKVAYELYEKSGKRGGRDLENWLEAENIVRARSASEEAGQAKGVESLNAVYAVDEKRRHKRFTLKGSQKKFPDSVNSRIINISADGVAIEATKKLEVNKDYNLNINYKGTPLRLKCRTVWSALTSEEKKESGDMIRIYTGGMKFYRPLSLNALGNK